MAHLTNNDNLEIARGNVQGLSVVNKFGANINSANGAWNVVWDGGGATYPYPATALITSMSQTANQAAMVGKTIEIQGLDANWDLVTQSKTLNATNTTTIVTLDTPLIRVFRAKVMANVISTSPIRIHNAGETVDYAIIQTGLNQTLMAIYTVPRGHTAYITNWYCDYVRTAVKDPDSIQFRLMAADRHNGYEFQIKHYKGIPKLSGGFQHKFEPYYKFTQKTDIRIGAYSDGAVANVQAGFDLILNDD